MCLCARVCVMMETDVVSKGRPFGIDGMLARNALATAPSRESDVSEHYVWAWEVVLSCTDQKISPLKRC